MWFFPALPWYFCLKDWSSKPTIQCSFWGPCHEYNSRLCSLTPSSKRPASQPILIYPVLLVSTLIAAVLEKPRLLKRVAWVTKRDQCHNVLFRQGLAIQPKLDWSSWSSCLCLPECCNLTLAVPGCHRYSCGEVYRDLVIISKAFWWPLCPLWDLRNCPLLMPGKWCPHAGQLQLMNTGLLPWPISPLPAGIRGKIFPLGNTLQLQWSCHSPGFHLSPTPAFF